MSSDKHCAAVIATGSFHTPSHYESLISALRIQGFDPVVCPQLPTNDITRASPDNVDDPAFDALPGPEGWPDGTSDAAVIHAETERLVKQKQEVLVFGHSSGGWTATEAATPELLRSTRTLKGLAGGIIGIFYLSGFVLSKGQSVHGAFSSEDVDAPMPPFVKLHKHGKRGLVTPVKVEEHMLPGAPEAIARTYASKLRAQPLLMTPLTNAPYRNVPCAYLRCLADTVLPPFVQDMLIKAAVDLEGYVEVYECDGDHCSHVMYAEQIAEKASLFLTKASKYRGHGWSQAHSVKLA